MKKFDEKNFFNETLATFNLCDKKMNRIPDYISDSGSKYWYTKKGVYRMSDHWSTIQLCHGNSEYMNGCGFISSCFWNLETLDKLPSVVYGKKIIGFANWNNFKKIQIIANKMFKYNVIDYFGDTSKEIIFIDDQTDGFVSLFSNMNIFNNSKIFMCCNVHDMRSLSFSVGSMFTWSYGVYYK